MNLATLACRLQSAQELQWGDFTTVPRGTRHSPEALAPEIIEVIFNLRQFGMVLDDPAANLGDFQENDLSR
ncbi:MAG: hypothetical protein ABSA70_04955 [Terriglobia bacterium]